MKFVPRIGDTTLHMTEFVVVGAELQADRVSVAWGTSTAADFCIILAADATPYTRRTGIWLAGFLHYAEN